MGFYAPYKLEQRSLWLIAFRTILGSQKDVVRLIAKKYLLHWFESEIDFSFSIDCGRIYVKHERRILNNKKCLLVKLGELGLSDFLCHLCVSYMKQKKNVVVFCDSSMNLVSQCMSFFVNHIVVARGLRQLKFNNSGWLTLYTLDASLITIRGISPDLIITTDFNQLDADVFNEVIAPLIEVGHSKFIGFCTSKSWRVDCFSQNILFGFENF